MAKTSERRSDRVLNVKGTRVAFDWRGGEKVGVVDGVGRFGRYVTVAVYEDVVLPRIPTLYTVAVSDLRDTRENAQ